MSLFLLSCIAMYYSVISVFTFLFSCSYSFFLVCVLCTLAGLIADLLNGNGKVSWIGIGVLMIPLLWGRSVVDYLTLCPPLVFSSILIIRGRNGLEYYTYRSFFKISMILWGLFYAVITMLCNFESLSGNRTTLNAMEPLKFGILSVFCSILLLRTLRLGAEDAQGKRLNRRQLVGSSACVAVVLGIFLVLEKIARDNMTTIKELAETAFVSFFSILLAPFGYLLRFLDKATREFNPSDYTTASVDETIETVAMPSGLGSLVPEPVEETSVFPWWLVILILGILAVCLFFMARILMKKEDKYIAAEVISEIPKEEHHQKEDRRSNRQKVRIAYREYLKKLKKNRVLLRKDMTTEDILSKNSKDNHPEAAKILRDIYLSARYDDAAVITAEQAKTAQAAQKQIH